MKKAVLLLLLSLIFVRGAFAEDSASSSPKSDATVDITLSEDAVSGYTVADPSAGSTPAVEPSASELAEHEAAAAPETASAVKEEPSETATTATPETVPLSESTLPALGETRQLIAAGDYAQAKKVLATAMSSFSDADKDQAEDLLAEINHKLLFDLGEFPDLTEHKVKPGESLYVIAKKYKTTPEFISILNHLKGSTIFPDQTLKIVSSPFSIQVSKAKNRLELYLGDEIIRTYHVATGTNNSTPVGSFTITTKLENPTWYKTGAVVPPDNKENILGTRWLGFSIAGYGIHGTTIPESIGTQSTAGCVRMRNNEVEELYALVPMGAVVTVTN